MKCSLFHRQIPLKIPLKTALRTVNCVDDLVFVVEADGLIGYGSTSPTVAITGDSIESISETTRTKICPSLKHTEKDNLIYTGCTSANSMVETALYDIWGKRENKSIASLLGQTTNHLISDLTISLNSPEEMVREALIAVKEGFSILKIKVGGDLNEDRRRLEAICAALPSSVRLRLDANQGWDEATAIKIIKEYEKKGYPIDLIEQPLPAYELLGMANVRKSVGIPILADESIFNAKDVKRILEHGSADIINIKLAKCGGITEALTMCKLAEEAGIPCMIGCMIEGPIGILAACHLAASQRIITRIDLDCPMLYKELPGTYATRFKGQDISIGTAPGLGILDCNLEGEATKRLWTLNL
jgi:L-alanine-DL-glutamate epimerase-like enolase superfamily enzyme